MALLETDTMSVTFGGLKAVDSVTFRRTRAGLGRTWQSVEPFQDLNVRENLEVAADRPHW